MKEGCRLLFAGSRPGLQKTGKNMLHRAQTCTARFRSLLWVTQVCNLCRGGLGRPPRGNAVMQTSCISYLIRYVWPRRVIISSSPFCWLART